MIHTFINGAIAHRTPRSALDLSERDTVHEHDIEALDRFEERDLNAHDELNVQRHHSVTGRADDDKAALSELTIIEANAPEATTPGGATGRAWRAFKVALLILCINLAAAALIAVVVIGPPLALLGFFVEFCVISFTGLPMLLATVSEALANDRG